MRHHRARGNGRPLAKCDAAHNRRVSADRSTLLHESWDDLPLRAGRPRIPVVSEYTRWAEEHVVGNRDAVIDADVVLDLYARTNRDIGVDVHVLAERGVFTDCGAGPDVRVMPNASPSTHIRSGLDDRRGVG